MEGVDTAELTKISLSEGRERVQGFCKIRCMKLGALSCGGKEQGLQGQTAWARILATAYQLRDLGQVS